MKTLKIVYWIATALTCLGLAASGFFQVSHAPQVIEGLTHLGYPEYMATILGIAKLSGSIFILYNGIKFLNEWAYGGAVIVFIGAALSHYFSGDGIKEVMTPLISLGIALASYFTKQHR